MNAPTATTRQIAPRQYFQTLMLWLFGPRFQRIIAALLRRFSPILVLGKRVIVTRHADVVDLLQRDGDFTIQPINGPGLDRVADHFFLGMDRPEYDREHTLVRQAVRRDDPERIERLARSEATALIAAARSRGRLDVVREYARVFAVRLAGEYFGLPGPDEATLMGWARTLFYDIFLEGSGRPARRAPAAQAAEDFKQYTAALVAERRAAQVTGRPNRDTVLDRLVAIEADDDVVRRNLCGLVLGAVEPTSKTVTLVIDQLLRRPGHLERAAAAARLGDIETVSAYSFEALRFNPHNPLLSRHCARDTDLGRGTGHRHPVAAGSTVYALTLSAMFDSAAFPTPAEFVPGRPTPYLHFGDGLHACFGRYINAVTIPELVAALLRLERLRRAPGFEGRVIYDRVFPDRLIVAFDPA